MKKWTVLVLVGLIVGSASGQESVPLSGKNALNILSQKFGANHFQWIVEMRAFNGVPQPSEWTVVAYDQASIYLLNEYWVGEGRAVNEGPYDEIYPDKAPIGFIDFAKLKLDSVAAFTVAEGEARKARVGFDSLNYVLRSREYSTEPVWILTLVDANESVVGKVHVSGLTGSVLRTVWINRQGPTPKIIDSALPGRRAPSAGAGTNAGANPQPQGGNAPQQQGGGSVVIPEQRVRGSLR